MSLWDIMVLLSFAGGIAGAWTIVVYRYLRRSGRWAYFVAGALVILILGVMPLGLRQYRAYTLERQARQALYSFMQTRNVPSTQLQVRSIQRVRDAWLVVYEDSGQARIALRLGDTWLDIVPKE